jgi:hypothetical protein
LFCGKRVGPDNRNGVSGTFCDESCNIAWQMKFPSINNSIVNFNQLGK